MHDREHDLHNKPVPAAAASAVAQEVAQIQELPVNDQHRESIRRRISRQLSVLMDNVKEGCDGDANECYGFSQACGQECSRVASHHQQGDNHSDGESSQNSTIHQGGSNRQQNGVVADIHIDHRCGPPTRGMDREAQAHGGLPDARASELHLDAVNDFPESVYPPYQHHHHVPQNAFLSIGLQTSLAIALHKLPEGFITYATNHASPQLGMTVFLALFIHNITEGFAMALPLYLALDSRVKAILWSSLLGGISQPAGAGIAALWIWASHKTGSNEGDVTAGPWGVYGCMFAATAGIMTVVGLQLFCEGAELTHHRGLCIGFAVTGMALMGFSFALTA